MFYYSRILNQNECDSMRIKKRYDSDKYSFRHYDPERAKKEKEHVRFKNTSGNKINNCKNYKLFKIDSDDCKTVGDDDSLIVTESDDEKDEKDEKDE